ncbi:MAG: AAA family ATPase [Brevundimonas sp.]|uniref:AAA family ATPase n=1 Tax=Brevundimonas sp. TaxID=1871086 RepID=UPI00391AFCB2
MAQWVRPPKLIDPRKIVVPKPALPGSSPVSEQAALSTATQPPTPVFSPKEEMRRLTAKHPLLRFSLLEDADKLEAEAADTKRLLGQFVMDGQATMIYAPPNTGKTLIIIFLILKAVEEGLIDPDSVFYFNADDGSLGLAVKNRLMAEVGAHMVAPGRRGLKTKHLVETMLQAAADGSARGTLIIIDTLKKFADPMDKKDSSRFAQVCREYVMAGGTIVALGHTRKTPKADGTYPYQGTTDIFEDFDAVYIASVVATKAAGRRVVRFKNEKKRADSPDVVAYSYADEAGISYEEKLASVQAIDPDDMEAWSEPGQGVEETRVITTLLRLIDDGFDGGRMALAKAAAMQCGVSERTALSVLQRYTGETFGEAYWTFQRVGRGKQVYATLTPS